MGERREGGFLFLNTLETRSDKTGAVPGRASQSLETEKVLGVPAQGIQQTTQVHRAFCRETAGWRLCHHYTRQRKQEVVLVLRLMGVFCDQAQQLVCVRTCMHTHARSHTLVGLLHIWKATFSKAFLQRGIAELACDGKNATGMLSCFLMNGLFNVWRWEDVSGRMGSRNPSCSN